MATKKAKTPKKRNPQDATRRNVQASNKRIEALENRMETIEEGFREAWAVSQRVHNLEMRAEAFDRGLGNVEKKIEAATDNVNHVLEITRGTLSDQDRFAALEARLDILAAGRPAPPQ